MVTVIPEVQKNLLSLEHVLVDLRTVADDDLSCGADLRTFLRALKYGTDPRSLLLRIEEMVVAMIGLSPADRPYMYNYLAGVPSLEIVEATLKRVAPTAGEEFIRLAQRPALAEAEAIGEAGGEAIGEARGKASGKAEGGAVAFAFAVIQVIEQRFGRAPPA